MEGLTELYLPGALTVWCALVFALAALWGYAEVAAGKESSRLFARRAYVCYVIAIVLASVVLAIALLRRDFRIEYVFQYSGLDLPIHYQFAAFWAGQKGSFLIWLLFSALIGLPLGRSAGRAEAPVMIPYTLTSLGLLFILVRENPFVMLAEAPLDGKGLNPLLQDDWMVIHPPIMFVGYALAAVPFCFAVSAMWRKKYDGWATRAFPWALAGFLVLGAAILLGGAWAYKTLGWGGYWGWDPVENASLIPWLLGVVLVHGLYLERVRKRYRRSNLIIACLVYMSVLYGTFLTRSGVLADFSVHSFVDLGISGWLIGLMAGFGGLSLYLLATRLPGVKTEPNEDPFVSRGTLMVMATIVVLISAIAVTFGTSSPLITRPFLDNPAQVGPSWYNSVHMPLALVAAGLLALVPFLSWRKEEKGAGKKLAIGAGIALLVAVAAAVVAVRHPVHLLFIFLASWALLSNLHKTVVLTRRGGLKAAGGYLAHVGVGIILIGFIASSSYDQSAKVTLTQGVPTPVGEDLTVTFNRFVPRGALPEECGRKECMEVEVARTDGTSYLAYPKLFVNDRTRQLMANPDVKVTLGKDYYVSPIEYDPGSQRGSGRTVELAKGESIEIGETTIRFLDFDLSGTHDAMAQQAAGGMIPVGARVEIDRGEQTVGYTPVYRFRQDGRVETPATQLAGGGFLYVAGINAAQGAVRLHFSGLPGIDVEVPAKLAVDITRKPLILLVWIGMGVILIGGTIAGIFRFKEALRLDRLEREAPAA